MRAEDESALIDVVQTDPFWLNGIIHNLQITQWDPFFGSCRELSSTPKDQTCQFEFCREQPAPVRSCPLQRVVGVGCRAKYMAGQSQDHRRYMEGQSRRVYASCGLRDRGGWVFHGRRTSNSAGGAPVLNDEKFNEVLDGR
jgi:hypothetical protein